MHILIHWIKKERSNMGLLDFLSKLGEKEIKKNNNYGLSSEEQERVDKDGYEPYNFEEDDVSIDSGISKVSNEEIQIAIDREELGRAK